MLPSLASENTTASNIVACLKSWAHLHQPRSNFTLSNVADLHVDASPQLLTKELKVTLTDDYGIHVIAAAPRHQPQNGTLERQWQTAPQVAFKVDMKERVFVKLPDYWCVDMPNNIKWKPHADWFLQARIQQGANGSISLAQHQ